MRIAGEHTHTECQTDPGKLYADAPHTDNAGAGEFRGGTPESIRKVTLDVMEKCCPHKNFVISSGCDIPPLSSWDNIDAYFAAVDEYYAKHA